MKKLMILATMLLSFGFANAQKIWNNDYKGGRPIGTYEGGEAGGAAAAFLLLL